MLVVSSVENQQSGENALESVSSMQGTLTVARLTVRTNAPIKGEMSAALQGYLNVKVSLVVVLRNLTAFLVLLLLHEKKNILYGLNLQF